MPKQKRWTIKRNLSQAANNIDHAINNVVTAGHEFEGVHPDYYQSFCSIAINLARIKECIAELEDLI
ncbi:unnamed protein product [marine sediment metagenome]|uniref:Uncharacterized protein n=1 Tax=marine sediment metagenome TaxID=412755 RepID=X1TZ48_9ZZZZ